ncbi:RDD family protein [Arcobacter lacus]|uniref:RDD family protein n=1 Tax=Arcobacter lacus TaxID=1912876 RepID=A0ABX5JP83_9BACT|nr:RDD family protein [Arcobacter lacus]MCT7908933.1 RDD family protein [Arcobacter lacus]MCT7910475.1 RDD family protein [Arcobacter lacus]PUE67388.1 RDD family protein [Arcobacter lacus]
MENNSSNLQLASMRSRAFAYIIDDLIVTIIVMAIFWDNIMSVSHDTDAMIYLMQTELVMPLFVLKIIYQTFFVWYYGATIGKIVAKIRVIDAYHWGRVSIFSALLRAVGRIFSEMFFYIGFLIGFFNDGRKTFHDFTGKTLVVNA